MTVYAAFLASYERFEGDDHKSAVSSLVGVFQTYEAAYAYLEEQIWGYEFHFIEAYDTETGLLVGRTEWRDGVYALHPYNKDASV